MLFEKKNTILMKPVVGTASDHHIVNPRQFLMGILSNRYRADAVLVWPHLLASIWMDVFGHRVGAKMILERIWPNVLIYGISSKIRLKRSLGVWLEGRKSSSCHSIRCCKNRGKGK
ncbi:unnamed protein product [Cuscuta epithymum]|uniref:Uncharacterized protein n=1 Tax=Cuscuta epithymum TaxID=186058 RepID=A0AAV0FN17_9ASTE|nr:unnamed protein product [Cuscuta epithymum]